MIQLDKRMTFGSLQTGRAATALRSDECPVFRNVQHDIDGMTRKRSGLALVGELACASEPDCWHQTPIEDPDGQLTAGLYYTRMTHVTLAGETDIIRQPGKPVMVTSPQDAIQVWHPFHLRKKLIEQFWNLPSDTPGLPVAPPAPVVVVNEPLGLLPAGWNTATLGTGYPMPPNRILPGSVTITSDGGVGSPLVDDGFGNLGGPVPGVGTINYETGEIHFLFDLTGNPASNVTASYTVVRVTRVYMIALHDGPPLSILESCPDAFKDYLLYSRAPRVQDQTRLGANPDASWPPYNRTIPLAKITLFASYLGLPVFVLNQSIIQIGQTGKIDRDTVDIMMPDRDGLPVLWWNLYLVPADDGVDTGYYRWAGSAIDGAGSVIARSYNINGIRSPLERVNRDMPGVAAVDGTDIDKNGASYPASTNNRGGLYGVRLTWTLSEKSVMQAPGWSVAAPLLGLGGRRAPLRSRQESVPSRVHYVELRDGQEIWVQRNVFEDTVSGWNIYVGECDPHRILDFTNSARIPGDDNPLHHATPYAQVSSAPGTYQQAPTNQLNITEFVDDNGEPSQPSEFITKRGLPNAYAQIVPFTDTSSSWFRFASSNDLSAETLMRFGFPLDTIVDAADLALTKHVVFRLFMRTRPGRLASYNPGIPVSNTQEFPKIRFWNGFGWVDVFVSKVITDGFMEYRIPLPLPTPGDATSLFNVVDGTRRFCVVQVHDQASIGYDINQPDLRLYRQTEADPLDLNLGALEPPLENEMLQVEDTTAVIVKLRIQLQQKRWWARPIRPDNTGMWPLQGYAENIPGNRGPKGQRIQRIFGAGDSMFRMHPSGKFERLWQYEGPKYADVVSDDFQQCNFLWRLFWCNPGMPEWNLRFDQQQSWPMGIAPIKEKGSITAVHEPVNGPGVTEDVAVEYYLVAVRFVKGGNGHVVRSEPLLFTQTEKVNIQEGFESSCLVEGTVTVEPEDTQLELYRNLMDTAFYKRCAVIPINESVVTADGRVRISIEDVFDGTDADLDITMEFNTGRPPAARMMKLHTGRVHFVPQEDPERDYFTNISSPDGLPNPEGWYDENAIDPPLKIAAAITCLSGATGPLHISTIKGMGRVDGVSADQDGKDAFVCVAIDADTGWSGPRASQEEGSTELGMTVYGPYVRQGDQCKFIGAPAQEIIAKAHLDSKSAYNTFCEQDQDGRVWFGFSDSPMSDVNGMLVLDQGKRGDGITPYWSEWRFRLHSTLVADLYNGKPVILIGGQDGRVYRYGGRFRTDAGAFIDAEMASRPEAAGGPIDSFRPDVCLWFVHGDRQDHVLVTVKKNMDTQRAVNEVPQRLRCNEPPVDANRNPIPLFGVGAFVPGSGQEYGMPDSRMEVERTTRIGTVFRTIQFKVWQKLDDMPTGSRREAGFECAGYMLQADDAGERRAG